MHTRSHVTGHERLRRLLGAEDGEDAVQRRLAALDEVEDAASVGVEADLRALSALANETRYRIVRLLAAAEGELAVAELDAVLEVSQSAISHALSELSEAGLVQRRRDGTWRYYSETDRAARLVAVLGETR